MDRLKFWLLFEALFVAAAFADYLTTWFGITFMDGVESHSNYNVAFALLFYTFINLVFYKLQPTWKWQIPRIAFLIYAWHPAIRNLILILLHI